MYVGAIHRISDPEEFFDVTQEILVALPLGVTINQILPSTDGKSCVSLWQSPSVQVVREIVDDASTGIAVNEFFEISAVQAVGLA
jgi:hypothetical protein